MPPLFAGGGGGCHSDVTTTPPRRGPCRDRRSLPEHGADRAVPLGRHLDPPGPLLGSHTNNAGRHAVQFGVSTRRGTWAICLTSGMSSASTGIISSVRSVCALHTTHCRPNVIFRIGLSGNNLWKQSKQIFWVIRSDLSVIGSGSGQRFVTPTGGATRSPVAPCWAACDQCTNRQCCLYTIGWRGIAFFSTCAFKSSIIPSSFPVSQFSQ